MTDRSGQSRSDTLSQTKQRREAAKICEFQVRVHYGRHSRRVAVRRVVKDLYRFAWQSRANLWPEISEM